MKTKCLIPIRHIAAASLMLLGVVTRAVADPVFPDATWETAIPESVSVDSAKLQEFQETVGGSGAVVRWVHDLHLGHAKYPSIYRVVFRG